MLNPNTQPSGDKRTGKATDKCCQKRFQPGIRAQRGDIN